MLGNGLGNVWQSLPRPLPKLEMLGNGLEKYLEIALALLGNGLGNVWQSLPRPLPNLAMLGNGLEIPGNRLGNA